ncbi:sensor histidine kinase [Streptomyces zhihengii]
MELSAYRIVQEAVTNVVRHAGTRRCDLVVDYGTDRLAVEITDDGPGTRPAARTPPPGPARTARGVPTAGGRRSRRGAGTGSPACASAPPCWTAG